MCSDLSPLIAVGLGGVDRSGQDFLTADLSGDLMEERISADEEEEEEEEGSPEASVGKEQHEAECNLIIYTMSRISGL